MQWENLTSLDFAQAVQTCNGVAILPIGVLEAHSAHLPLGMDAFEVHTASCRAAEIEPVLVFPLYPYGVNHESMHLPGAVIIKRDVILALLENICDEMGRNGISKIILISGHGGNRYMLPFFVQTLVEKEKPYTVYYGDAWGDVPDDLIEADETGHACEEETSRMLHINADLVKMQQVPEKIFRNLKRNAALEAAGVYSPVDWYEQYPAMYVGNASKATAEKGAVFMENRVQAIVKLIRAVKVDTISPTLLNEFQERTKAPKPAPFWTEKTES